MGFVRVSALRDRDVEALEPHCSFGSLQVRVVDEAPRVGALQNPTTRHDRSASEISGAA